jgi:hypothetical protein
MRMRGRPDRSDACAGRLIALAGASNIDATTIRKPAAYHPIAAADPGSPTEGSPDADGRGRPCRRAARPAQRMKFGYSPGSSIAVEAPALMGSRRIVARPSTNKARDCLGCESMDEHESLSEAARGASASIPSAPRRSGPSLGFRSVIAIAPRVKLGPVVCSFQFGRASAPTGTIAIG